MIIYCSKCETGNDSRDSACQVCGHPLKAVERAKAVECPKQILVTTGDLRDNYRIIGPVFFYVTNRMSSNFGALKKEYEGKIAEMRTKGRPSAPTADFDLWGVLVGEWSVEQTDPELVFFIAVQELKKRAEMLGADAIISMRQDIRTTVPGLGPEGFTFFDIQMYGTAVKIKTCEATDDP